MVLRKIPGTHGNDETTLEIGVGKGDPYFSRVRYAHARHDHIDLPFEEGRYQLVPGKLHKLEWQTEFTGKHTRKISLESRNFSPFFEDHRRRIGSDADNQRS